MKGERRILENDVEWRVKENEDGSVTLIGHAIVFDSMSIPIAKQFREIVRRGAITRTINDGHQIKSYWNHNVDYVLGSRGAGTMRVAEDDKGLLVEIDAPNTQTVNDLVITPIRRGDVDQMSFAFDVNGQNGQKWTARGAAPYDLRELLDIDVHDACPVASACYTQTDVDLRSTQYKQFRKEIEEFEREREAQRISIENRCREMGLYL